VHVVRDTDVSSFRQGFSTRRPIDVVAEHVEVVALQLLDRHLPYVDANAYAELVGAHGALHVQGAHHGDTHLAKHGEETVAGVLDARTGGVAGDDLPQNGVMLAQQRVVVTAGHALFELRRSCDVREQDDKQRLPRFRREAGNGDLPVARVVRFCL
jgi:hypothetical protein